MSAHQPRPVAVMMSKRANVFYLEHIRVMQKDSRVVYLTQTHSSVEQIVNIPDKNTAFLLLGRGTSITDAAMRMLAESNVIVGFCGSGGSPLHGISDPMFITPQDEYRPTQYMQQWVQMWFDDELRLNAAKQMLRTRIQWNRKKYPIVADFDLPDALLETFSEQIQSATNTTQLLTAEARYAKHLYALHAQANKLKFTREPGKGQKNSPEARANSYLDHGNYLAYGYAAVALHTLGISFAFPLLHGKTRRGALVFDVADLIKDWLVMPLAFSCATTKEDPKKLDNIFRAKVIEAAMEHEILDSMMDFLKDLPESVDS